jgi:hypothetical protein
MSLQCNAGAVRRFSAALRFGAWLQALPGRLVPPPFRLVQIGSAFWQSRALHVAAQLDVATRLGDEELGADALAARVAADPDALARLLRMLAAIGVFDETARGVFRNNKVSAGLRSDHPQSVRAMVLMHNSEPMSRPWFEQLERGVREGVPPFRLAHGEELFDYCDHHPDFDKQFSEAMDSVEALAGDSFVTDFDWSRFERIIDVGGSRGSKSLAILKHHPKLEALVVDRPQVIAEAQRHRQQSGGAERLSFAAGDVLKAVPPARDSGDIYLLAAVLHGFDDDTAATALRNVAAACGDSGARIAVAELVAPETSTDTATASFDMQMFMATRGRERTLNEWRALLTRAGLQLDEVVGLRSFPSILVASRAR